MPYDIDTIDALSYYKELSSNVSPTYYIFTLALTILLIIALWKVFEKASEPGWASIVPFYSSYVLYKITWGNGWLFLLNLLAIIPIVGSIAVIIINIITIAKLAKAFGKDGWFAFGMVILSFIFIPILGFGDAKYVGIKK